MIEERIAEAIRGACPEMFTDETHTADFPELTARANVLPAIREALAGPEGEKVAEELGLTSVSTRSGVRAFETLFRLPEETT